jgi:hypothetical protein
MTLDDIKARCIEEGECWIWQGALNAGGYPIMKAKGVRGGCLLVRRVAISLDGRPPKPRQPVVTKCGDKRCCKPACMKLSTPSSVGKQAAKKGAFSSASRRSKIAESRRTNSKLTQEQVQEIRVSTESGPVLAARYGIVKSTVSGIKRGELRRDYTNPFAGLL